jgi:tetratricopeptide (TPR) repeat protein
MKMPQCAGLLLAGLLGLAAAGTLPAQEFWGAGQTFTAVRRVTLPPGIAVPGVLVAEFLAHGELAADGSNLAVYDGTDHVVPWRVLQAGPGDICRVAFQTHPHIRDYRIFYGGKPTERALRWTATAGLLLETRRWKNCELDQAASVRAAFETAAPDGADLVGEVFHRFNPFRPDPEPFLSRYQGVLHAPRSGTYSFFTSSQDCSFLCIDGRFVVAAPGQHGPVGDARLRGDIELSAGPHRFEYLHAAYGPDACMVAAWRPPGAANLEVIPARAFGFDDVGHVIPGPPRHIRRGPLPDFAVLVLGDAAVSSSELPMVRVRFTEDPARPGAVKGRRHWDFGDGQTADEADPVHVYLHPGLYAIKMVVPGGPEVTQRLRIHRAVVPPEPKKGLDQAADYLPIINRYDPRKLPDMAILQLVRFCEDVGQHDRAVKVGRSRLLADPPPREEAVVRALAGLIGPRLRDAMEDPASAAAVWEAAARAAVSPHARAECELEAADIRLHDLQQRDEAGKLLRAAAGRLPVVADARLHGKEQRLWGDWYARGGDREAARTAYTKAAECCRRESTVEHEARRGAFGRSAEAFLRDGELDRAREELRRWQDESPADKIEGFLPLLWARYYVARGKLGHAIAAAHDLLAVNSEAPDADVLVLLAAECEEKLGHTDRARAGYQALLSDYPGSPLVAAARRKLATPAKDLPAKGGRP